MRRWLQALKVEVAELSAALRDRVREKPERVLSRYEAKRQGRRAERSVGQLFAAAEAGLGPQGPCPAPPNVPDDDEADELSPSSGRRAVAPVEGEAG